MKAALSRNLSVAFISLVATSLLIGSWELLALSGQLLKVFPAPSQVYEFAVEEMENFFSRSEGSFGAGIHLYHSIKRVLIGFFIACVVGIPIGIILGFSGVLGRAFYPHVHILRQVSPLAWLPIGLALTRNSEYAAIFVIAICSVWPIMLSVASSIAFIPKAYYEVAGVFGIRGFRFIRRVLMPSILPQVIASMRVGFGISWMVIVAAEMLVGNRGIGYFIWNEWNNLNLSGVIFAILLIGAVGILVDSLFVQLEQAFNYNKRR
ncbi:MAG: ABC transporter permease [Aquificaceae bacterium]|uniref:ABC transporter permease n=1 Tax=Hydrogenobacter sp. Uz 6-8 TaxID=3384828 RepID=UPI00309C80A2